MGFLDRIFKREQYNVGVDIGSHSVKVAVLERQQDETFELKEGFIFPLFPGTIEEGKIKDEESLINTLKSVKKAIPRGNFIAVLPSTASLVTTFELPEDATEEQVEYLVVEGIAKKIPVSISEVNFDYYTVEVEGRKFVTSVIGKKEIIRKFISLYEKAGVKLEAITSAYTALSNAFFVNYPDTARKCVYLVDVGYNISTFCFLSGDLMVHGRSSTLGTKRIEDYISTALNIEATQVRELMEKNEIDDQIMDEALKNFAELLAEELEAYSIFCEQHHSVEKRDFVNIYVSGGAAELPKFVPLLSSFLPEGFKALQFDPFRMVKISKTITTHVTDIKNIFAIAVGAGVS